MKIDPANIVKLKSQINIVYEWYYMAIECRKLTAALNYSRDLFALKELLKRERSLEKENQLKLF